MKSQRGSLEIDKVLMISQSLEQTLFWCSKTLIKIMFKTMLRARTGSSFLLIFNETFFRLFGPFSLSLTHLMTFDSSREAFSCYSATAPPMRHYCVPTPISACRTLWGHCSSTSFSILIIKWVGIGSSASLLWGPERKKLSEFVLIAQ